MTQDPPQSVVPGAQLDAQTPALHTWPDAQALPQAPQWLTWVSRLTSHPLAAVPSQSANPGLHEPTAHRPEVHAGVALGTRQGAPHPPQLFTSAAVSTSQPSVGFPLQSAKPALHDAIEHLLSVQAARACASVHAFPQLPQLAGSPESDTHAPLQSVSCGPHVELQTDALQTCPEGQTLPQAPQFWGSLDRVTQTPLHSVSLLVHPASPASTSAPASASTGGDPSPSGTSAFASIASVLASAESGLASTSSLASEASESALASAASTLDSAAPS